MKVSIDKRLKAIENQVASDLYVCIFKGKPPHTALIHHLDKKVKEEPIIFENDADLDAWLASLPKNAKTVVITCENVTGVELHSFGS
jgi:predicted nuclease of predicted toxin-antitoxin system